jgi:hypothetical protein
MPRSQEIVQNDQLLALKRRSENKEEVMSDVVFNEPVILRMPKTGFRKVATGFEALECLEREWPDWARGRRWRNAIVACRDALDGWRSAKEARRSFMKAAMRAGLVQGARRTRVRGALGSYQGISAGLQ